MQPLSTYSFAGHKGSYVLVESLVFQAKLQERAQNKKSDTLSTGPRKRKIFEHVGSLVP